MTSFYFVVATVPLALYWLALAWLHSRPQPFAVDGRRDFIALALALFGVLFVGPGSITPPVSAAIAWGANVWLLCGVLYFCVVVLLSSLQRPRIVVYNATCEELRATLSRVALSLDDEARWAGASSPTNDATRSQQGWLRLEKELRVELARTEAPRRRGWLAFAALGWGAALAAGVVFFERQEAIANAFHFYLSV